MSDSNKSPWDDPGQRILGTVLFVLMGGPIVAIAAFVWMSPEAPDWIRYIFVFSCTMVVVWFIFGLIMMFSKPFREIAFGFVLALAYLPLRLPFITLPLKLMVIFVGASLASSIFALLVLVFNAIVGPIPRLFTQVITVALLLAELAAGYAFYKLIPVQKWREIEQEMRNPWKRDKRPNS